MSDVLLVIPARYASTRFPAKVLASLDGKPILQWVYEACVKSGTGDVIIATEDNTVVKAAKKFGANAVMTSAKCASGTDRVYEASLGRKEKIIVNVQSDEPFIQSSTLKAAVEILKNDSSADISTAYAKIKTPADITDPNCVKIAMTPKGKALYFSRSPIPYHHQLSDLKDSVPWYKHCGLYGYRRESLERFVKLPPSRLELLERLEQLRALEAGMTIKCAEVEFLGPAIDVPEDLDKAVEFLKTLKRS